MATLETERLILREWTARDFPPLAAMNADPEVMRYFPSTLTKDESREQFERAKSLQARNGYHFQPIEERETGKFAGFVGLAPVLIDVPFAPAVEIGWRMPLDCWGKGYATEAASAWLGYGFETLGLDEIVSFAVEANHRSHAVMARIGMTQDVAGSFFHPKFDDPSDPLALHVLYRLQCGEYEAVNVAAG
ncbi:MAG: GNAT family N-acetyltransferase [Alphaproteobacteria bacterium]|nr:GNAT family N-acetyltransferase [Alphaproteobacteria bacterium]